MLRYFCISLLLCISLSQVKAQPFTPDKYGYVADKKFHKLIKERGYQLVTKFHKIDSWHEELYANVYFNGEWKYINTSGELFDKSDFQKKHYKAELYNESSDNDDYDLVPEPAPVQESPPVSLPKVANPYSDYSTKSVKGKYGTVNWKTQKVGLPYIYDRISSVSPGIVVIVKDRKYGLAYRSGEIIVAPTYDKINSYNRYYGHNENDPLLIVMDKGKYGVIDTAGKTTVPVIYDMLVKCYECGNDLLKVKLDNKWGVISEGNKQIIPIAYGDVLTNLKTKGIMQVRTIASIKFGLVDTLGKFLLDTVQDFIGVEKKWGHKEGYILYGKDNLFGAIDLKGNPFLPQIYTSISERTDGVFWVQQNKMYGLVDGKGKEMVPVKYLEIVTYIKDGFIIAKDANENYGVLSFDNKELISFSYEELSVYSDQKFFFKKKGKYGIMNKKGKVLKKFKYQKMMNVKDFFLVREEGLEGIIDENENILLPIEFNDISHPTDLFYHGYCKVRKFGTDSYLYADRYGNVTQVVFRNRK